MANEREDDGGGGGGMVCVGGIVGGNGDGAKGAAVGVENGSAADGNSAGSSCDGLRTYKRRRQTKTSSSETNLLEDGKVAADSVIQDPDKTVKEAMDRVLQNSIEQASRPRMESHAVMSTSVDWPLYQWRNIVLEQYYQSICGNEGGLQGCIKDALLFHPESSCGTAVKGSIHSCVDNGKCTSPAAGWRVNGTLSATKQHKDLISDGSPSESNSTNAEQCQRAFFDTITSEKFSQLCRLLLENFQGIKVDRFLDISSIDSKLKDGAYERSPTMFHSDMQQLCTKLQKVGAEMVALGKSLSETSRISYHEQQFRDGEPEQTENRGSYKFCGCRLCGEKTDGRDCLVCDSCEDMYHVSCIEPPVEEIPSQSWYCKNCTASGIELPHDNCAVCKKLSTSRSSDNGVGENVQENGERLVELEQNLNGSMDFGLQGENLHQCNVCGSEVDNCDSLRVCGHPYCPHKYYHVRCLTNKQLGTYGPHWYCPSCLCRGCLIDRDDEKIVLCDGCDHAYHIYCMRPERVTVPKGKWFCRKCNAGIRRIKQAKRVYEDIQNKLTMRGEYEEETPENLERALSDKDGETVDKSGGVDMLLNAAKTLNYEEKMAMVAAKS